MDPKELTIDDVMRNDLLKGSIRGLIAFVVMVLGAVGVISYAAMAGKLEDMTFVSISGGLIAVAFVTIIVTLIAFIVGIIGKSTFKSYIKKAGEDNVMNEIHNDTLYIYERKGKPITIITRYHIFDLAHGIYNTKGLDYCYGYSYRGNTSIRAQYVNNAYIGFAKGIPFKSDEILKCFSALKTVNPNLLIGFNYDNSIEHTRRYKEFKAQNKK